MHNTPAKSSAASLLHPDVLRWVARNGWSTLRPVQESAIPVVLSRASDVIISAPTAAGKTEAAWLPILSNLLGEPGHEGFQALMVSPLKALINDQTLRLEDMTADLGGIDVTPWHGDVAYSRKASAIRSPSGVLLTTPESLEAMLALRSHWAEEAFRHLRYVVIDELHAFYGSERGIQLQSLLRRLEGLTRNNPPRIALGATLADTEAAARFLRPDGSRPCHFAVDKGGAAPARIALKEYVAADNSNPEELITDELYNRLRGTNNLIFTNSRKDAEAFSVALSKKCNTEHVPDEFRIHHGSLARTDRQAVERELQQGHYPVSAICTASMELGIDIGRVNSVAQIGTVSSPDTLRQRLGRSGRRGQPPVLRIYSIDEKRDDYKFHLRTNLVQNIAVTELAAAGVYDPAPAPESFTSIAVQQILSLMAQYGSFYPSEAYLELAGEGAPFSFLSQQDFGTLLQHLEEKKVISSLATGQLTVGTEGERIMGKRDFYSAFTTPKDYTILDRATGRTVGAVQYKPYYGEVFILAGQYWIVDGVEERSSTAHVSLTSGKGKMMFEGTGPESSPLVTAKMLEVYTSSRTYPYLDSVTATGEQLVKAREWFARNDLAHRRWLISGNDGLAFLSWAGMRANRAIAVMAQAWMGVNPQYDHLALSGLSPEMVMAIAHMAEQKHADGTDIGAELASAVNRRKKERGKYDLWLPDALLDRQYAATRLDVEGALKALKMADADGGR